MHRRQVGPTDIQVFESMKHEHSQHDGDEARQGAHNIHSSHAVPLLEQDDGVGDDHGSKEHIVDGEHQGSIKNVQRPVEEVDLSAEAKRQDEGQDVGQGMPNNGQPLKEVPNGDAQTLDGNHREGPDHRADDDVNEDVPLSVTGRDDEDEDETGHQQKHSKDNEPCGEGGTQVTPAAKDRLSF